MKTKIIAAAALTLCSSAAFAAGTTLACDKTTALTTINTCSTDAKASDFAFLYITGSSALKTAVSTVVPADLFDGTVTTVFYGGSENGGYNSTKKEGNNVVGWYGTSKAAVTGGQAKRLYVVLNTNNGSAAGVSQLLAKFDGKNKTVPEQLVMTVGPVGNTPGTCVEHTSAKGVAGVLCSTDALRQADIAISDVAPAELYKLYTGATGKLSTLTSTPIAMQGFGLAVSADLYAALQTAQGTSGQPSIRRVDYASLVTGAVKSSAALGVNGPLVLARRDDQSGTQAASNIFFANNACGNNRDAKNKLIPGVLGGLQPVLGAANSVPGLTVQELTSGGAVVTALNASGYAVGALGLGTSKAGSDSWNWVKLDGVAPNVDDLNRGAFASGDYPWAVTSFAVTVTKPKVNKATLNDALIAALKDSNQHNLAGIAYLDDGVAARQSKVVRPGNNNCAPLVRKN